MNLDLAKRKAELKTAVVESLGSDRHEPGAVLYNGWVTLCAGPIYIVGLNPGGNPTRGKSIAASLEVLRDDDCAYTKECWSPNNQKLEPGKAPHQRRVTELARIFGRDVESVCATNAIFFRTIDAASLESPVEQFGKCWPVHQKLLSWVRPDVVLCLGNSDKLSAFKLIHSKVKASEICRVGNSFRDGKYFDAKISVDEGDQIRALVVGLPHPSRFPPSETLKQFLSQTATSLCLNRR